MRALLTGFLALFPLTAYGSLLTAQASPIVSADDPRLPLFEHMVIRGDVADPSPMWRPIRRRQVFEALNQATGGQLAAKLVEEFQDEPIKKEGASWQVAGRGGFQSFTHARRELLQPTGDGGTRPYVEGSVTGRTMFAVMSARAAWEPRLSMDPDWLDSASAEPRDEEWRIMDAYVSVEGKGVTVTYGMFDRSWGMAGASGLPASTDGYPQDGLAFSYTRGKLQVDFSGAPLRQVQDPVVVDHYRYTTSHRFALRLNPALTIALWETGIVSTESRNVVTTIASPFYPLVLKGIFGNSEDANSIIGADLSWRLGRPLLLQAQFALDDKGSANVEDARPARWGGTLGLAGPLGQTLSWRARVTAASSLLYRTTRPEEFYTDGTVGLGRNFADQVQATLAFGVPVEGVWLVTPEITWLKQGEGNLRTPFPTGADLAATPTFFIGTPTRTWRFGLGVSGQKGALGLKGSGGLHAISNDGHVEGSSTTRFEGRIQLTFGFSSGGPSKRRQ
ncbi:MAG TPA: hypothetical protein VJU15_02175 [Gemmatimonadales bacterium]|nr:hypothetical protein [Gemmatimonadales bacterium]